MQRSCKYHTYADFPLVAFMSRDLCHETLDYQFFTNPWRIPYSHFEYSFEFAKTLECGYFKVIIRCQHNPRSGHSLLAIAQNLVIRRRLQHRLKSGCTCINFRTRDLFSPCLKPLLALHSVRWDSTSIISEKIEAIFVNGFRVWITWPDRIIRWKIPGGENFVIQSL